MLVTTTFMPAWAACAATTLATICCVAVISPSGTATCQYLGADHLTTQLELIRGITPGSRRASPLTAKPVIRKSFSLARGLRVASSLGTLVARSTSRRTTASSGTSAGDCFLLFHVFHPS